MKGSSVQIRFPACLKRVEGFGFQSFLFSSNIFKRFFINEKAYRSQTSFHSCNLYVFYFLSNDCFSTLQNHPEPVLPHHRFLHRYQVLQGQILHLYSQRTHSPEMAFLHIQEESLRLSLIHIWTLPTIA